MNSPKNKIVFSSPTGVTETWQLWEGLPAIPVFQDPPKQVVRFSDAAIVVVDPDWTRDDLQDLWWTKEEIKGFQREAKNQAKGFRATHAIYIECLSTLLKECKKEPNLQRVLISPSAQEVLWLSPSSARGLEARLHNIFGKYRVVHVKKLLEVQHSMTARTTTSLEQSLRASARHTSRPSRALAQLLAQGDHLQVSARYDSASLSLEYV
jgi:hypothetical protein